MSKSKMLAAKQLIQEKKYTEARSILATVDHPTAREWEAKLDKLAPRKPLMPRGKKLRVILLIAGLLFLGGVVIFSILDNQRIARNIQAIKDQNAEEAYLRALEYCTIHYNNNPQGFDLCMKDRTE